LESEDDLLDMSQIQHVRCISGQEEAPTVIVGAGCQIRKILAELKRQREWTLPSVGFVTEPSIAGPIATGTHGSGKNSLSHYVTKVRFACYDHQTGQAIIETIGQGLELKAARCAYRLLRSR
jgi:FAD/FMN-containing dehydrogenase